MESAQTTSYRLSKFIDRIVILSASERACLVYFKNLYIKHGGRMLYPSVATIAKHLGVSQNTARRHVHRLRALGVLSEHRGGGGSTPTMYQFDELKTLELAYIKPLARPASRKLVAVK